VLSSISPAKTDRKYFHQWPYDFAITASTEDWVRTCCKSTGSLFNSIQTMNNVVVSQTKPDENVVDKCKITLDDRLSTLFTLNWNFN